jgi:hypothetical protein
VKLELVIKFFNKTSLRMLYEYMVVGHKNSRFFVTIKVLLSIKII